MRITRWNKKEKPNLENLKKELEKEDLHPYIFSSEIGDYFPDHLHKHDEIRIVISGSMKFGVKNQEVVLNEGDRLNLPRNILHWAKVIGKKRCIMLSASRY